MWPVTGLYTMRGRALERAGGARPLTGIGSNRVSVYLWMGKRAHKQEWSAMALPGGKPKPRRG